VNILDENIPKPQRELLEGRRIAVKQVGVNIARKGLLDEEIIPLLQHLRLPTFFTRDRDFYERHLCHSECCLVYLSVERSEAALFVRRFLRHPFFKTRASRMGRVIRVRTLGFHCGGDINRKNSTSIGNEIRSPVLNRYSTSL
jgi:hypothetical protein